MANLHNFTFCYIEFYAPSLGPWAEFINQIFSDILCWFFLTEKFEKFTFKCLKAPFLKTFFSGLYNFT